MAGGERRSSPALTGHPSSPRGGGIPVGRARRARRPRNDHRSPPVNPSNDQGAGLMDDIVALKVVLDEGPNQYFLTWGRLIDPVETKSLEELVGSHLAQFGLGGAAVSISVCDSIRAASRARYFYECFFQMCQSPFPLVTATRTGQHRFWSS